MVKGMILAAGLGERLRPLTNSVPKPMVPVGGRPLIEYHLALMARASIRDVMINLHWLGEQIEAHIGDGSAWGLNICYSYEDPILGTGGGIKVAENFFGDDPAVIVNGDILIDTEIEQVLDFHLSGGYPATMVLHQLMPGETYTPISIESKKVIGIGGDNCDDVPHYVYTGLQVLQPECFSYLRPEYSSIVTDFYLPALRENRKIGAFVIDGYWSDLGTPERYEAVKDDPPVLLRLPKL
jgi:NDP-sugar pyrophosphorylase family protein